MAMIQSCVSNVAATRRAVLVAEQIQNQYHVDNIYGQKIIRGGVVDFLIDDMLGEFEKRLKEMSNEIITEWDKIKAGTETIENCWQKCLDDREDKYGSHDDFWTDVIKKLAQRLVKMVMDTMSCSKEEGETDEEYRNRISANAQEQNKLKNDMNTSMGRRYNEMINMIDEYEKRKNSAWNDF